MVFNFRGSLVSQAYSRSVRKIKILLISVMFVNAAFFD